MQFIILCALFVFTVFHKFNNAVFHFYLYVVKFGYLISHCFHFSLSPTNKNSEFPNDDLKSRYAPSSSNNLGNFDHIGATTSGGDRTPLLLSLFRHWMSYNGINFSLHSYTICIYWNVLHIPTYGFSKMWKCVHHLTFSNVPCGAIHSCFYREAKDEPFVERK